LLGRKIQSEDMQDAPLSSTAPAAPESLLARYNNYFRTQPADTQALIRTAQAIRYQVYCLERKFENPDEHGDCLEQDAFDGQSVHGLIFHRPTSDAIGTARLILPRATLPIRQLLAESGFRAGDYFPLDTTAEVSRFAISNQFRRRRSDGVFAAEDGRHARDAECRSSLPFLGLAQEIIRQSRITACASRPMPASPTRWSGCGVSIPIIGWWRRMQDRSSLHNPSNATPHSSRPPQGARLTATRLAANSPAAGRSGNNAPGLPCCVA
jgi:hypothetical protein